MKKILWKTLICVLIVMMLTNFAGATFQNNVYAASIGEVFAAGGGLGGGIVNVILWAIRAPLLALAKGLNSIISALAVVGNGGEIDGDLDRIG